MVSSKECNEVRIDGDVKLDLENAKRGTNSRQKTHMVRIATGILVWTLICIPSNIVAGIFYFRQKDFGPYDQSIDSNNSMNSHYIEDELKMSNFSTVSTENGQNIFMDDYEDSNNIGTYNNISIGSNNSIKCYAPLDEVKVLREKSWFWIEGVFLFVVGTIGLLGNILAILILKSSPENTSFNMLLIYLAFCDIALIGDMLVQKMATYYLKDPIWYAMLFPYYWHPAKGIFLSASMFMIIAVSAERYRAICYPFTTPQSPHRYAAIAFLSSFVLKIPRFFHFELNYNGTDYQTTKIYEDKQYITFSNYWDDIVVTGLLPILILAWLNLKIYLKVRASRKMRKVGLVTEGLRINRPSISYSARSRKLSVPAFHVNSHNPIITLNGKIIDGERNGLCSNKSNCSLQKEGKETQTHSIYQKNVNKSNLSRFSTSYEFDKICKEGELNTPNLRRSLSEGHLIHKTKVIRVEAKNTFSFNEPKRRKLKFQSTLSSTVQNSEKSNLLSLKAQQNMQRRKGSCHNEKYKEKSCSMLLAIVFLFVLTHSFRLAFKFYEILIPNTAEQFERCLRINRHHVPFVLYILLWLNNLVVVINSSLNFLIYCCVSESFRARTFSILGSKPSC